VPKGHFRDFFWGRQGLRTTSSGLRPPPPPRGRITSTPSPWRGGVGRGCRRRHVSSHLLLPSSHFRDFFRVTHFPSRVHFRAQQSDPSPFQGEGARRA